MQVRIPQPEREPLLSSALSGFARAAAPVRFSMRSALYRGLAVLAATAAVGGFAAAQTAQFAGYETALPLTESLPQPVAVAVDAAGDVFVSDAANKEVVKLAPSGNSYSQSTVASSLAHAPDGIAVDAAGNVYIADSGDQQLYKVPWSGIAYGSPTGLLPAATYAPLDVTADQNGLLYFTSSGSTNVYDVVNTGGTPSVIGQFTGLLIAPRGIVWQKTVGTNGILFVSDNSAGVVYESPYTGSFATPTLVPTTGLANPMRIAVDANGDLYIADSANNRAVEVPWNGSAWQPQTVVASSVLSNPQAVATDAAGNVYIADTGNNRVLKESKGAVNLGSVAVGTTGSPTTLLFTFGGGGSTSLGSASVLTQGASGLDFADAGTGTCKAGQSYSSGTTCTLNATFAPRYPGARYGAVVLEDTNGNVLATGYIYGTGTGPQIGFMPFEANPAPPPPNVPLSEAVIDGYSVNADNPNGIAVDAAGDVFLSDTANHQVIKLTAGVSGYTPMTIATGLAYPNGIAVDGAGNVFIADSGCQLSTISCQSSPAAGQLYEVSWNGFSYGAKQGLLAASTYAPAGVAVDAAGDLFFTEGLNSLSPYVGEIYADHIVVGGSTPTQLTQFTGATFSLPSGIALDAAGNLFVTDSNWTAATGGSAVWELQWSGSAWAVSATALSTVSGLQTPSGIVLDASEGLYVADYNLHYVYKYPWVSGTTWGAQATLPISKLDTVTGVALDGSGNLYVTECNCDAYSKSRALKEDYVDAPTLTFAETEVSATSSDSPQYITIENNGNATLDLIGPTPTPPSDFDLTGGTCATFEVSGQLAAGNSCQLNASFNPWQAGNLSEGLTLTDNNLNAASVAQTIQFTGTAYPKLDIQPSAISFGNQAQGTTANAWTMTIEDDSSIQMTGITISISTANGTDNDNHTNFAPSPNPFSIQSTTCPTQPFTLASYATCNVLVTFAPPATGHSSDSYTATLTVTDASGVTQSFPLTGTGTGNTVSLNPNPVNFSTQTINVASGVQIATLSNTSGGPVTLTGATIAGITPVGNTAFVITATTCGAATIAPNGQSATFPANTTLAQGANCTFSMTFTPTVANQSYSATLSIADNAPNSPQSASLVGSGVAQNIFVSSSSINFGKLTVGVSSTPYTVTLNNASSEPVNNVNISIVGIGSSGYSQTNTCPNSGINFTLPANTTCNIYVVFQPPSAAIGGTTYNATLQVTDSVTSPLTVSLTGTGTQPTAALAPNSANFSTVAVGSSSGQTEVLSNTSGGTLTNIIVTLTNAAGNPASAKSPNGFFITSTTCAGTISPSGTSMTAFTLATGATCAINMTFTPQVAGDYSGTLKVTGGGVITPSSIPLTGVATSNSANMSMSPSSINFGSETVGSTTSTWNVTLSNSGQQPLSGLTVVLSGLNATDFHITSNTCGSTLAASSTCLIQLDFNPQAAGARTATLTATYTSGGGGSSTTALTGTGVLPTAVLSPPNLNFGDVWEGYYSTVQVTVTNTSDAPLTLNSISPNPAGTPFALSSLGSCVLGGTLPANGGSCTFDITFTPTAAGTANQTLSVSLTDNAIGPPYTFSVTENLMGQGDAPTLSITPNSLNFGNVVVGAGPTAPQSFTVTNTSGGKLTLSGITISGPFALVHSNACAVGTQLIGSGASCTVYVTFSPISVGSMSGTVIIASNAVNGSQVENLYGSGLANLPDVSFAPTTINFGNYQAGSASNLWNMTLNNTGNVSITLPATGLSLSDTTDYTLVPANPCAAVTLGPGNTSCSFQVKFNPPPSWPPTESTLPVTGTLTVQPTAVVVDATGDVFVSDVANDQVVELVPAGSTYLQNVVASSSNGGLASPHGLTLDGSGNLYIADNGQILKVACPGGVCGTPSTLVSGLGLQVEDVAFDPVNNAIWYTMMTDPNVWSVPTTGGSPTNYSSANFASTPFTQPLGLAWQTTGNSPTKGNLFISDTTANTVTEWTWNGSAWVSDGTVSASGLSHPTSLAVDSAGDLYIANTGANQVVQVPWTGAGWGTQVTVPTSSLNQPAGIALSASGNLFIADTQNHRVIEEAFGTVGAKPATLTASYTGGGNGSVTASFSANSVLPAVAVSPVNLSYNTVFGTKSVDQTVSLAMSGNGLVSYSYSFSGTPFFIDPTGTTCVVSGGTLTSTNRSCTIALYFNPSPSTTQFSGTLTFTDNGTGSPQTVFLTGTIQPAPQTITFSPIASPVTYGIGPIALSATGGASGNPVVFTVLSGPANVSGPNGSTLNITGAGTVVVAANQAGNSDFVAAPQVTQNVTVNPATPTVTAWPTASSISGGQALSSSTLSGGSASVPGAFTWTSPGTMPPVGSDSESVTFSPYDIADYVTVTGLVSVTVTAPPAPLIRTSSFSLVATPSSLSLHAGQSGTVSLTLVPSGGYQGTVQLSCPNLPSGVTCSFSATSLTADGHDTPSSSQLTISTVGLSASAAPSRAGGNSALAGVMLLPGLFFGSLLLWRRRKLALWAKQLLIVGMVASALAGLSGCGGGSSFTNTLTGTQTVTVAAQATPASGGASSTNTGNLTVTITQ